jgi:hypothetical protein
MQNPKYRGKGLAMHNKKRAKMPSKELPLVKSKQK